MPVYRKAESRKGAPKYNHIPIFKDKKEYEEWFLKTAGVVPELKYWKECEVGEWALADDGGVTQIVGRFRGTKSRIKVSTAVGIFLIKVRMNEGEEEYVDVNKPPYVMDTDLDKHPVRYTFSGKKEHVQLNSKKLKRYIHCVALGMDEKMAFSIAYANDKVSKSYLYKIKESPEVQEKIMSEMTDIASIIGIDHQYILEQKKKLIEDENINDDLKNNILNHLGEQIGTFKSEKAISASTQQLSFPGFQIKSTPVPMKEIQEGPAKEDE